jgi:hypothetical protein
MINELVPGPLSTDERGLFIMSGKELQRGFNSFGINRYYAIPTIFDANFTWRIFIGVIWSTPCYGKSSFSTFQ